MPDFKYVPAQGCRLYNHLGAMAASDLFHERHIPGLAHPADIFSEKFDQVITFFCRVTDRLDDEESDAELAGLVRELIFAVNEFYDQLFLVIKCLTPPPQGQAGDEKDVIGFLKLENGAVLKKFYGATKAQHALIRDITNALKHQPAKLAHLRVVNHRAVTVKGFFVQVVRGPNDQRGPDLKIHPFYRSIVNTAFSYNHFLLNVAGRLFSYMDWMDKSLFPGAAPSTVLPFSSLAQLATKATELKMEFFPDEYQRPFAKVKLLRENYVVSFPARYQCRPHEDPDQIRGGRTPVDVNRRTMSAHSLLPYLQLSRPEVAAGLAPR